MKLKILVVDDETNILKTISICLRSAGHQVLSAVSGTDGVQKAFAHKPDLILLDILLPELNGLLVLEALREDERTSGTPIIVISGRAEDSDIEKALTKGANDYLVKPFKPVELLEHVHRYSLKSYEGEKQ